MRILLLNQFVPPEGAPTARLLGDLASHFREAGHEVALIGATQGYRQSGGGLRARLLRDLKAHVMLAWRTLMAGRADWILCLSDPPGLPFTAYLLAKLKRARLAHWAMDVYPEVAIALGALPSGLPSQCIRWAMRHGYRASNVLVALDEDMADRIRSGRMDIVKVCPPWPPLPHAIPTPCESLAKLKQIHPGARIWLYSGNLGRAHEFESLLHAQSLLEQTGENWHLVFQGGGPCRIEAQTRATEMGLRNCHWLPYAEDAEFIDSLNAADVLVATQKLSTQGMLWPSKLALMMLMNRPIAWIGPLNGSISQTVSRKGDESAAFSPDDGEAIVQWLRTVPGSKPPVDWHTLAEQTDTVRIHGQRQWLEWMCNRD
mgnify:CR=1 FL=1